VNCEVGIWPMSFVFPKGWRLVLTVGSTDCQPRTSRARGPIYGKQIPAGSSVLLHDHPEGPDPERSE